MSKTLRSATPRYSPEEEAQDEQPETVQQRLVAKKQALDLRQARKVKHQAVAA